MLTNLCPGSSRRKEKIQINKIRNERGEITTDATELWKTIREFYEQLYKKQILQPRRNGQLLRNIQPTKMKSIKEIDNFNRSISRSKIVLLKKSSLQTKFRGHMSFRRILPDIQRST